MHDDPKEKVLSDDFLDDLLDCDDLYMGGSACANDCTGLVPAGPTSEAELLSYKDVYSFPSPFVVKEKGVYKLDDM